MLLWQEGRETSQSHGLIPVLALIVEYEGMASSTAPLVAFLSYQGCSAILILPDKGLVLSGEALGNFCPVFLGHARRPFEISYSRHAVQRTIDVGLA